MAKITKGFGWISNGQFTIHYYHLRVKLQVTRLAVGSLRRFKRRLLLACRQSLASPSIISPPFLGHPLNLDQITRACSDSLLNGVATLFFLHLWDRRRCCFLHCALANFIISQFYSGSTLSVSSALVAHYLWVASISQAWLGGTFRAILRAAKLRVYALDRIS